MKVGKNFCLDINIAKMLSEEPNQSGIVNRLLENYFSEKAMAEREKEEKNKFDEQTKKDLEEVDELKRYQ